MRGETFVPAAAVEYLMRNDGPRRGRLPSVQWRAAARAATVRTATGRCACAPAGQNLGPLLLPRGLARSAASPPDPAASRRAPAAQRAARRAHVAPQERQAAHDARTEVARTKLGQLLHEEPFAAGGSAHCGAMSGGSASSGPRGTNGKARDVFILTRAFATRIKRRCAGREQEDSISSFTHMSLVRPRARTADQV